MMSTLPSRTRRSGFTLVEVAIALAIFVFGALAIVQIFPPALGVIRNNESRVAGTQLSETLLARTSGKPISLPDAIYESDGTGNWLTTAGSESDIPMAVVGTPSKNSSLPSSVLPSDFTRSALGRFRYIKGERQQVRGDGSNKYVLLNSPIDPGTATNPTPRTVFVELEEEIDGVQITANGTLDFKYATDSAGNPFHGAIPATGPTPQKPDKDDDAGVTYYVSYKWSYGTGPVNGVVDEPIVLPDTWSGTEGRVLQGVIDTTDHIIPGTVKVFYRQRLGSVTPTAEEAIRGYVNLSSFAPTSPLPAVDANKIYSFSYLSADPRWMIDDRNAPSPTGVVQLPVRNLDQEPVGTPTLPSVLGLRTTIGSTSLPTLVGGGGTPVPDPLTLSPANYKEGTVPYSAGSGVRYRTVYRALDGWAQQLSVAAKSYIPFYQASQFGGTRPTNVLPQERWREYMWSIGDAGYLYFHASEAGKSVLVSYVYDDGGTSRTISGAVLTIDDDLEDAKLTEFGKKVSVANITDLAGNPVTTVKAILSVQGLSVQARTAWQNADRYNQVIVPAYRTLMQ